MVEMSPAFAAARDWRPEPTPEAEDDALPSAADVAIGILLDHRRGPDAAAEPAYAGATVSQATGTGGGGAGGCSLIEE